MKDTNNKNCIQTIKFSIFYGGSRNTYPNGEIDIKELIRLFSSDEKIKKIIKDIRDEEDEVKQNKLKNKLPYITTSGIFAYRNDKSILTESYTWLCAIDVDEKDNLNIDFSKLFETLKKDNIIILASKSPRGKGIKALIQLKKGSYLYAKQYDTFRDIVYPALDKRWNCKLDRAQGKLSQPFFLTHDPNLHVNKNYKVFDIDYNVVNPDAIISGEVSINIKELTPFVNGIVKQEFNKWDYFNRVSMFVGGLYAGEMIKGNQETVLNTLIEASNNNPYVSDYKVAEKTIRNGFKHGLTRPLDKDFLKAKANINIILGYLHGRIAGEQQFIRVGDDYFKKIFKVNSSKIKEPDLISIKRQTIVDDFGKSFLPKIPKYETFCNVPDYLNFKPVYSGNYNLFHPFAHKIKKGEWPTIEVLFKHIFGDQYEMGLDYIQLLLMKPTQMLPVFCLVSQENQTGKTTFIDFLSVMFKGNTAIISTKDIEGSFNQHYALKHIIAVDESDLAKERTTSRIKQLATQKTEFRKGKFQNEYEVDYFGKLILISNNERSFINIKEEDIRYWVRKVPKIENYDPDFFNKLTKGIPAFTDFLINRKLIHSKSKGRAWFSDSDYNTQWLNEAKKENKTALFHDLKERFLDWFGNHPEEEKLICRPMDIKDYFFENNSQYSSKYIKKVLRDEFKLEAKMQRAGCNISDQVKNKVPGEYYSFTIRDLQKGAKTIDNVCITNDMPNFKSVK